VLTDAVSDKILLDYFYGVLFRLCQMHLVRGERESLAEQTPVLFEMLWGAIANSRPAFTPTRRRDLHFSAGKNMGR